MANGTVYFSNFADQRLYRQDSRSEPRPITPEREMRYADGIIDSERGKMICVREDHTDAGQEAVNAIVILDLHEGDPGQVWVSGKDFFSVA